ncbi:L-threonine 3-dehydrogenase [uncultured archaeon]|nr:L-threonine 3-dehydrogenase [uncultured archaeon]
MKTAVWYGGKDIRIEDTSTPDVEDNEVLVKVHAVAICGSDLHAYKGMSKRRKPPLVMGHEFSGEIIDIGKKVKRFSDGERVVVEPLISCGKCKPCKIGKTNICEERKLIGLNSSGAFAEYVSVPENKCHKLLNSVSFEEAALAEPLAVAVHAVNITPIEKGDTVLIIGSGTIGLLTMQVARNGKASNIFATDVYDYLLDLAKKFGANMVINTKDDDLFKTISSNVGSIDVVFEAVGLQGTVQQALSIVRCGGCVTLIGMFEDKMELNMLNIAVKEIMIQGSYGYTSDDFKQALKLIASGKVKVKQLITHVLPLDDITKGFELLAEKKENVIKVVLKP